MKMEIWYSFDTVPTSTPVVLTADNVRPGLALTDLVLAAGRLRSSMFMTVGSVRTGSITTDDYTRAVCSSKLSGPVSAKRRIELRRDYPESL